MNNISSRKRPRSSSRYMRDEEEPKAVTSTKDTACLRSKGSQFNTSYRSTFCLSVLLVQLARVNSWSPSSIAKTFRQPSTSNPLAHNRDSTDALFWASLADQPTIPSSELLSSRYLVPSKTKQNNNLLTMSSSAPSMLLKDDFFFPLSTQSLATSEHVRRGQIVDQGNSLMKSQTQNDREGRVLGFDVFALQSTKSPETPSASASGEEEYPGLTWQNSPLPNTANDNLEASSLAAIQNRGSNNNGGVRLLKYDDSPLLPAWFPWIPTKSQIKTLKLKELKEACSQRGLTKVGSIVLGVSDNRFGDIISHSCLLFYRPETRMLCKSASLNGQRNIRCSIKLV